uniref:NADH-ubiquinone oxidoreductase chain 4 n=1 Tax=Amblyseius hainanensis TaxID=3061184 RepID=A0AAU6PBF6_9ACAR
MLFSWLFVWILIFSFIMSSFQMVFVVLSVFIFLSTGGGVFWNSLILSEAYYDMLGYMLIYLSLLIIIFFNLIYYNCKLNYILSGATLFCLFNCFTMSSFLLLYIFFEISLLPLIFLIYMEGGSMERFSAIMYLVAYTVLGALLLLLMMLNFKFSLSFSLIKFSLILQDAGLMWILGFFMFLIKMPLYGFHFWLPKAHVEAPVGGSMLLAGILLKLGGFGMNRMMIFVSFNSLKMFLNFLVVFSCLGALMVGLICLRQVDMKMLIAYSSVSHMSLLVSSMLSLSKLGILGASGMMVAHGICSSNMFFAGNIFYERYKSRNLYIFKGALQVLPFVGICWLLLNLINGGVPPFYNFFCEIFMVYSILKKSILFLLPLAVILFLGFFYSLVLYLWMGHGFCWKIGPVKFVNFKEMFILVGHLMFLIIFILKFSLFYFKMAG